jgi:septal ring-binding cell division protein DamX
VSTNLDGEPPTVTLGGKAVDGETVTVFSFAGATQVVATDGEWEVVLELTAIEQAPDGKLLIEVSYGDGVPSKVVWVKLPVDESKGDEPKAEEPEPDEPKADEPKAEPESPKDEPKPPATVAFTAVVNDTWLENNPPKGCSPASSTVSSTSRRTTPATGACGCTCTRWIRARPPTSV